MKKADIISTYNGLLPELYDLAEHYEKVTGKKYQGTDMRGFRSMNERHLTWAKDDLERLLYEVHKYITDIPKDEENFVANRDFKESEQGKLFIANLQAKRSSLYKEIKDVAKSFYESFNSVLASVGLSDWMVQARIPEEEIFPYILPTRRYVYLDIQKKDMPYATLHVTINRDRGEWKMSVSSSMHTQIGGIQAKDEQYHQYKAYVTFHDYAIVFQTWMENGYSALANECERLTEEIDNIENDLKDPWTTWKESTM